MMMLCFGCDGRRMLHGSSCLFDKNAPASIVTK